MSKRGGGKNRVCFHCRIKYPSKFTDDAKSFNVTSLCSQCSAVLSSINDSICVPRKVDTKAWDALEKQSLAGTLRKPLTARDIKIGRFEDGNQELSTKIFLKGNRESARREYHEVCTEHTSIVLRVIPILDVLANREDFRSFRSNMTKDDEHVYDIVTRYAAHCPEDVTNVRFKALIKKLAKREVYAC